LQDEKFGKIIDELNGTQRRKYQRVVGTPIEWFRLCEEASSLRGPGTTSVKGEAGVEIRRIAAEEFRKTGGPELPEIFDHFLWTLLGEPAIWRELELTSEQTDQLRKLLVAIDLGCAVATSDLQIRKQDLITMKEDVQYDLLTSVLMPDQVNWLRHAELQVRLAENRATFGLADPLLTEELNLSTKQSERIKHIAKDFSQREEEYTTKVHSVLRRHLAQSFGSYMDVLTTEQRRLYGHLLGNVKPVEYW
jgi:hypothetical protein